ncbi:phosphotransferase family protein [Modestobacter versicolor]|uniref:phosphotransferase family protein n=1 Tax=Modestobacter versicolor TaxID=429133 RepID=UPI0034DF11F5
MQEPLSRAELDRVVGAAVGVPLHAVRRLTEGTFNTAYALTLGDGRELVLKVAPPPKTPLLGYEHDLLATEAMCLERFAGRVPVPDLVATGTTPGGRGFLLTSLLPGASWQSQAAAIGPDERAVLRHQVGRHVAAMHGVTGAAGFGHPAGPLAPSWPEAYRRIVDGLLADAERYAVALPVPAGELRDRVAGPAVALLGVVTTPVLVHFDLWDGNVFVDLTGPRPAVTGFIDAERALWADPAAELVSLALLGDIADDADFLAGYAEAGGPVVLDDATRARLHLYRVLLALVMVVEAVPRATAVPAHAEWDARVADWLVRELGEL